MGETSESSKGGETGVRGGVGAIIVTHYRLGEQLLQALLLIVPDAPPYEAVSIEPGQSVDSMRETIASALSRADAGEGVLVLTDMFGGTPSNMSLSFLKERWVEVVTGVNLPMLIKLATMSEPIGLPELAAYIRDYGQRNIRVAREFFPEGEQ